MRRRETNKYYYTRSHRTRKLAPNGILKRFFQLCLGAFFIVFIFTGNTPWEIFKNTIKAINGNTETISLYANFARRDKLAEDLTLGWWKTDDIKGAPELGPDAELYEFSDRNSSFYAGGNFSVVLGDFELLKFEEQVLTDEVEEDVLFDVVDENHPSSEYKQEDDITVKSAGSSDVDLSSISTSSIEVASTTLEEISTSSAEEMLDDGFEETEEFEDVEIVSEEIYSTEISQGEVEVVEKDGEELLEEENLVEVVEVVEEVQEEIETIEIITEEEMFENEEENREIILEEDLEDISFLEKVKNSFKALTVKAQEFLSRDVESLSDLGEFKSAALKLSIGIGEKSEIAELREEHLVVSENVLTENVEDMIFDHPEIIENETEKIVLTVVPEILATTTEEINDSEEETATSSELFTEETASSTESVKDEVLQEESEVATGTISILDRFVKQAKAQSGSAKIIIWYKTDSTAPSASSSQYSVWHKLDTISGDKISNALNGDYFSYDLDFIASWEEIENLEIRLEGIVSEHESFLVYIDSLWIDAEYARETELEKLKKRQRWEEALDFLTDNLVFNPADGGELRFKYNKNEERIWDTLEEIMGIGNFWSEVELEVNLFDSRGEIVDVELTMMFEEDGEFVISLPSDMRTMRPGKYSLKFYITDSSGETEEVFEYIQDFSWGVLAFNVNKSEYRTDEEAYLQFGVVDVNGHTVCNAELVVEITKPNGKTSILQTDTEEFISKIIKNPECGADNVISTPDYYAYYKLDEEGEYKVVVKTDIGIGEKTIVDTIYVRDEKVLEIERKGPTRIFPKADYDMTILITANEDFKGDVREIIPSGFKIKNYKLKIINSDDRDPYGSDYTFIEKELNNQKELAWKDVDLLTGDVLEIKYSFDAPDRAPEFYLLGPLSLSQIDFDYTEKRAWQIASDAVNTRARTVKFMAGAYNGGATTGNQTNADYTLSAFNFSLAETGVDIKNAFIVFETQFEAYSSTGGTYTGYKLGFDTCAGSSCTSAFGVGSGQVLDNNSSILAYDEAESNQIRLLMDVTNETQLAAYTGGGTQMEAQVGYHIKNGTTKDSIGNAKAVLVLTYTYDKDSENLTNTVSYPLDSTNGTDSGSRQASQGACTRDSTCPKFDYNTEIPEWGGIATTTYRLSQWFIMYGANDSNGSTDINPDLNIEYGGVTTNPNSVAFHHESSNAGTQGNFPAMYFDEWASSGYEENVVQQAEMFFDAGTNFAVGGEVFETYVASSSASTKTRTVAFPIGIINNGNTTSLTSGSVDVLFPENGDTTGRVDVKSVWVRLIAHHHNSGAEDITVSTQVGDNTVSGDLVYTYNGGGTVIKPAFTIVHILPSADYTELEKANATTSKTITVNTTYSEAEYGGISAELMITYTYTDDSNGYLTNIELFAGQSSAAPAISATLTTANSVLPENSGKTILGASLFSSFLNSDTGNDIGAGTVFLYDSNMSTGTPTCTNAFEVEPDDVNNYAEFYNDVTNAMDTTDNQSYNTCYSVDESLVSTDGAKMGGVLSYIYAWENTAPTSTLLSLQQKTDDSGVVDVSILVDDNEGDSVRVKLEFATGTTCVFSPSGDPSLDETDSNITATYQDPNIENDNEYQIGTVDSYIHTASGTNIVYFDWLAENDLGEQEGYYCLGLTANDLSVDQENLSTSTVYVDTISPSSPGSLSFYARTGTELILSLGATSTETNFNEYKLFYKVYDGTDVDEGDSVVSSSTDINFADILFNDAATTSVSGLTASTTYSVSIWAYDDYGNKASSSRVDIVTNDAPTGVFNTINTAQKTDGSGIVDISIEADDLNNHDTLKAKIEYSTSTNCSFVSTGDPSLNENPSNVLADFGLPTIENDNEYQVGANGAWILTSPGSNTVDFDWFSRINETTADGEHCLRLTVNDRFDNQLVLATTSLVLDNINPTVPGNLIQGEVTTNSIKLWYASTTPSTDTNEPTTDAYKIFYKQAASGATLNDIEIDNTDLNAYDYNSASFFTLSSLNENTWYVFNIWSFDQFGNIATATEIAIKTNATVSNDSFIFINSETDGLDTNIALGGSDEWIFRAVVSETNGWQVIASTTISLANKNDDEAPFEDLVFSWSQTGDIFSELGTDLNNMATISANSSSTCAVNTCTLDFKIVFNKTFASTSKEYVVKLSTGNDIDVIDSETFTDFYQVRFPYVEQKHYRFRRDDGGE